MFDSWMGERAVQYRRINRLPDDWGTAVNVQQMVYGNKGETSCSGVAFSRDEVTGAPTPSGDFLPRAQGEDVVSGVRTPRDLSELRDWMPEVADQLTEILRKLEAHYKDMQDTEFTVEEGRLFMLQTRSAKRPAQAAVRFAVDAFEERLLTQGRGGRDDRRRSARRAPAPLVRHHGALHGARSRGRGLAGCGEGHDRVHRAGRRRAGGRREGGDPRAAVHRGRRRRRVPCRRRDPDLGGRQGLARGAGGTRHGPSGGHRCGRAGRRPQAGEVRIGDLVLHAGDFIAIDGTNGVITTDDVPLVEAHIDARFETVLRWADELRQVGVRANADTPGGRRPRAPLRRRGDRAVPDRAHVHGR